MQKEKIKSLAIVVLLAACITLSVFMYTGQPKKISSQSNINGSGYFESIIYMLNDKHLGGVTGKKVVEGALKGMIDSLDTYSIFYPGDQMDTVLEKQEGLYAGIGIALEKTGHQTIVTEVYKDSPAEKSGVKAGDIFIKIDGKDITKEPQDKIVSMLKGDPNTKTRISLLRSINGKPLEVEITRGKIKVNSVEYKKNGDIGYIKISSFDDNTSELFTKALADIDKDKINKIVLDLRDNRGGDISQAVEVAKKLVPKGLITKVDYKNKSFQNKEYYSSLDKTKYKLNVLVNGMTASSAEILASAIQDRDAGKLIGKKTFGKGKVQKLIPILTPEAYVKYKNKFNKNIVDGYDLSENYKIETMKTDAIGMAAITAGLYITPKGKIIDEKGLQPDITIENPTDEEQSAIQSMGTLNESSNIALNGEGIDVLNAEKILKLSGYEIDEPDTVLDQKTSEELKRFQNKIRITNSGILDTQTLQALNRKAKELLVKMDKQYQKAIEVLNSGS